MEQAKKALFTTRRGLMHSSTVPFAKLRMALPMKRYSPILVAGFRELPLLETSYQVCVAPVRVEVGRAGENSL